MGPARFLDKLYGDLEGNATSADKLKIARTINGTSFNGSSNITTANWGTARNIYIQDSDGSHTGAAVSVNGGANATLKLPATIKATLKGNADTASQLKFYSTAGEYTKHTLAYFNANLANSGTAVAGSNDSPSTSATWWHFLRFTHSNSAGYYTDLAIPFNSNSLYYKRISGGSVANSTTNAGWVQILDVLNYSSTLDSRYVNVSGDTMTGDLKFTTKGIHFVPGDTDQYLWKVYSTTDGNYGFRLQYNGAGSGNNNSLSLIADNQTGTEVNAATILQDGTITFANTLILSKTTDAVGTADDKPALIVGGTSTAAHLELDNNELMAKTNGTSAADLYLNANGGLVHIGSGGLQVDSGDIHVTGAAGSTAGRSIKVTNANGSVGIFTSTNQGLYDFNKGEWIIYRLTGTSTTLVPAWGTKGSSSLPVYFSGGQPVACNSTLAVSITGNAATATKLKLYEARASSANLNKTANYGGAGALFHLVATSSTTTGKCPTDANVLQMNWDNDGGYDAQFAISTAGCRAYFRDQVSSGTAWREFAHIAGGTATGSATLPVYVTNTGRVTACTASSLFSALSWTGGTSAGPTLSVTVAGQTRTAVIPSASSSASGIVTTGSQTLAGAKTFTSAMTLRSSASWSAFQYYNTNLSNVGLVLVQYTPLDSAGTAVTSNRLYVRTYSYTSGTKTRLDYYEDFRFPSVSANRTSSSTYDVLTSKSKVTVAQGGTGTGTKGACADGALYNLGCVYSATEPTSPYAGMVWLKPIT